MGIQQELRLSWKALREVGCWLDGLSFLDSCAKEVEYKVRKREGVDNGCTRKGSYRGKKGKKTNKKKVDDSQCPYS